jgi:ATP/maltotriose-dependent transcriptional regulator MalT
VTAKKAQDLARAGGDIYLLNLISTLQTFSFLHLGEWRKLQQSVAAALAIIDKNGNRQDSVLCRLTIAWLHAEALDFEGARRLCEGALDPKVEANPFVFFMGRTLLAKACLRLRDYTAAMAQFSQIIRRIEIDGIAIDSTVAPHFYRDFSEYWLTIGDLRQARVQAMRLYDITAPPPDRTYLALAHRLLAKISLAEGDKAGASAQISRAIAIVEQGEYPIAAWRVFATAAHIARLHGKSEDAATFHARAEKIIFGLAANLDLDDPLRLSLLAGFEERARIQ